MLADVQVTLGTNVFKDYTASIDATVATRIMDAGGIIVGKSGMLDPSTAWTK